MSGSSRGEDGWLGFDPPVPDQDEAAAADRADAQDVGPDPELTAGGWLRHDLPPSPEPTAEPLPDDPTPTGAAPATPWLAPEVEVAPAASTSVDAHDTGVPPTLAESPSAVAPTAPVTTGAPPAAVAQGRQHDPAPSQVPSRHEPVARADAAYEPAAEPATHPEHGRTETIRTLDTNPDARGDAAGVLPTAGRRTGSRHGAAGAPPPGGLAVVGAAVKEFAIVVGMALVLSFVVKTWLLQAFYIPSGSMEDTLVLNDRVIVSKLTPGPVDLKRGDIIVFADPGQWLDETPPKQQGPLATIVSETLTFVGLLPDDSENHLIKRVIGLPGDHVVCCDEGSRITINGTPIKEPYLKPGDAASEQEFDITVPPGRVWVMGDHRSNSADSRAHDGPENNGTQGSVDERLIVGRAVALVWPLDHMTWLSNPTTTFAKVPAPDPEGATTPDAPPSDPVTVSPDGEGGGEVGGDADTPSGGG